MWENTTAIHSILKKKNYKVKFLTSSIKKKSTNIILKNKKIKKKNYVEKHRSNAQYFKGKKLQSEIFN
jgi:hypothetical protein